MAEKTFTAYSAAMPTTVPIVGQTLSASATKILQQIAPNVAGSGRELHVIEWGVAFDGTTVQTPILCELIDVNVAASGGTAYVDADIVKNNCPNDAISTIQKGTALSCYAPTTMNAVTAARLGDFQPVSPAGPTLWKQFPLGREFEVALARFLQVRVTTAAGVTPKAWSYITWSE